MEFLKNIFKGLTNFSFDRYVTLELVKVIYFILVLIATFTTLGFLGSSIVMMNSYGGGFIGFVMLLVSPAVFVLMLIGSRIALETIIAIIRTEQNTRK
ncbi:MAG: DUF4282 domain-containing protein [Methylophaga sp.]|nr:DUF4282 domain-containing protein [Methylophaga sp.]